MTILERIQKLRDEAGGISINRLEKEAGVTRGSIAKWDISTPSYEKAKKVADFFGVSVEYILTGNENKPTENGELTETQREAMELIKQMSDEQLQIFVATLKATRGN